RRTQQYAAAGERPPQPPLLVCRDRLRSLPGPAATGTPVVPGPVASAPVPPRVASGRSVGRSCALHCNANAVHRQGCRTLTSWDIGRASTTTGLGVMIVGDARHASQAGSDPPFTTDRGVAQTAPQPRYHDQWELSR